MVTSPGASVLRGLGKLAAAAAIGAAVAVLGPHDPARADEPTALTGDEIRQIVVGHTWKGQGWQESYRPNGRIVGSAGARGYFGSWSINGTQFCADYRGVTYDGCWTIHRNGEDGITFLGDDSAEPIHARKVQ